MVMSRFPTATTHDIIGRNYSKDGAHDVVFTVLRGKVGIWQIEVKDVKDKIEGMLEILRKLEAGR
jgi:hypothetical protein